jgi:hypothetical protein
MATAATLTLWPDIHARAAQWCNDRKPSARTGKPIHSLRESGVMAVEKSGNRKTGILSTTYVSQASCDATCRLHPANNNGETVCYANSDHAGLWTRTVNGSPVFGAMALARNEAAAIDTLTGREPLRLHVVGDCATNGAAKAVAAACDRYFARGGGKAYTYTHAWRSVRRDAWGNVSVLASCEIADDITAAKKRGYATAVVYGGPMQEKPFVMVDSKGNEHTCITCPAQLTAMRAKTNPDTARVNCATCPFLCRSDKNLQAKGITVAFHAHGEGAGRLDKALVALANGVDDTPAMAA